MFLFLPYYSLAVVCYNQLDGSAIAYWPSAVLDANVPLVFTYYYIHKILFTLLSLGRQILQLD